MHHSAFYRALSARHADRAELCPALHHATILCISARISDIIALHIHSAVVDQAVPKQCYLSFEETTLLSSSRDQFFWQVCCGWCQLLVDLNLGSYTATHTQDLHTDSIPLQLRHQKISMLNVFCSYYSENNLSYSNPHMYVFIYFVCLCVCVCVCVCVSNQGVGNLVYSLCCLVNIHSYTQSYLFW